MKASHRNTLESIPWLVTGRIADDERQALERHIGECQECRAELALQQRVHAAIANDVPRVDYAPGNSLQKLMSRIGDVEQSVTAAAPSRSDKRPGFLRFTHWLAAAVVVEAVGIVWLAVTMQQPTVAAESLPNYRTVTYTEIVPQTTVLRVVFASTLSVNEMNALLDKHQLTIVQGPSKNGAYALAINASQSDLAGKVPDALAALQKHPGVRFAEPIGAALRNSDKGVERRP